MSHSGHVPVSRTKTPPGCEARQPFSLSREASDAIRVARVLCILFMVSVHFWPGATRVLEADVAAPLHFAYLVIIDYLGRSSVPLLSVVSGVLLAVSFARTDRPLALVAGKARAFLLPMVAWSAILLLLLGAYAQLTGKTDKLPDDAMGWVNALFAVTAPPANLPLGFLRDVFLAAVLAVAGLSLYRRAPFLGIGVLVIAAAVEVATDGLLFLRPQILTFYVLGVLIAVAGRSGFRPSWPLVAGLLLTEVGLRHGLAVQESSDGAALAMSYLSRIAMSLLMWRAALAISGAGGALARATRFVEPHVFVIFCSHMITIAVVAAVAQALRITETSAIYPAVFLGQFVLITAVGLAISLLGRRYMPAVMALLTGKSLPPRTAGLRRPVRAHAAPLSTDESEARAGA